MKKLYIAAASLMLILTGCSMPGDFLIKDPYLETTRAASGGVVIKDTQRYWREWVEAVNPQISSEIAGWHPPGYAPWNEKWVRQLRSIEKNQENSKKYVNYIIERRRAAHLAELIGYP